MATTFTREIENHLESHPSVEMAAVVGVPDERFQEVGAAFVVISAEQQSTDKESLISQLKAHCSEHLANYKIPKTISIVDSLPILPVGKVDKVTLEKTGV